MICADKYVQANEDYQKLVKRVLLSNLLRTISLCTKPDGLSMFPDMIKIPIDQYHQIIDFLHYLGGTNHNFPKMPKVFSNLLQSNTYKQIKILGSIVPSEKDPFQNGIDILREFSAANFPLVTKILGNIHTNTFYRDAQILPEGLTNMVAEVLSELFRGDAKNVKGILFDEYLEDVTQILPLYLLPNDNDCEGSPSDENRQMSTALKAINSLYYDII